MNVIITKGPRYEEAVQSAQRYFYLFALEGLIGQSKAGPTTHSKIEQDPSNTRSPKYD